MSLWLLLIGFIIRKCACAPQKTEVEMVESLRRQLMHENYDYMEGSDSDAITTTAVPPPELEREPDAMEEFLDTRSPVQRDLAPQLPDLAPLPPRPPDHDRTAARPRVLKDQTTTTTVGPDLKSLQDPLSPSRRKLDDVVEQINDLELKSEKKNLLNYLDDSKLDEQFLNQLDDLIGDETISSTTPRYKILTERRRIGGNRRSGGGGKNKRMFLQEERDGLIAIVNLDGGPFPEFRLPKSRRQYMAEEYDEFKALEQSVANTTTDTTPTTTPLPKTKPEQTNSVPLSWSMEDETTKTSIKTTDSREHGLLMARIYQEQLEERKRMRKKLHNQKRDSFELDHPDIALREGSFNNGSRTKKLPNKTQRILNSIPTTF